MCGAFRSQKLISEMELFLAWIRWLADFWMRLCVEAGAVGTKLRPKASTSVSMNDSWWEEGLLWLYLWVFPGRVSSMRAWSMIT